MNRLRLLMTAGGILILCLILVLIHSSGGGPVSVRFLGYTNNATGILKGRFRVDNKGSRELIIGVLPSELQEGTHWRASGPHRYMVLTSVAAQKDADILWTAPTNGVMWRLSVSYWSPKSDGARFKFGQLLNRLHLTKGDHYFCPTVASPPVPPYSKSPSSK